ncbi:diacylglycerol/lipid kinase family protein [Alkalibacillus haloalkaliphilus]|uniref:Diacylglycerol kinase n=1 Tax=Alkalibacillus haloalkaliphilus TaxID=94136 RepID=A0A511W1U4_9BACI|nr:diacylglycerol kinase family protein [Alkalibacillus haloalkaliphilus]GEN45070.1 diacylglycerol kinase [Alkalibacillus haloalkaliphilus]
MYHFIVNTNSGSGRGFKRWVQIESILLERKIVYDVSFTKKPNHATQLVHDLAHDSPNVSAIIIVGGDGTVHEAINGLQNSNVPLGIIPAGSGNDFCRGMGIPLNCVEALERILKNEKKLIDVGHINNKVFATIAGIGFDGKIAAETSRSKLKKLCNVIKIGSIPYILAMLKVMLSYKPTDVNLRIDSKASSHENVWLIAIANTPFYAGGMKICPEARNNDDLFEVCIVKGISRWKLLRIFPSVFKGQHINHPAVRTYQGKNLIISSNNPMIAHGDGEIVGETPFNIKILPSSIYVLS